MVACDFNSISIGELSINLYELVSMDTDDVDFSKQLICWRIIFNNFFFHKKRRNFVLIEIENVMEIDILISKPVMQLKKKKETKNISDILEQMSKWGKKIARAKKKHTHFSLNEKPSKMPSHLTRFWKAIFAAFPYQKTCKFNCQSRCWNFRFVSMKLSFFFTICMAIDMSNKPIAVHHFKY